MLCSWCGRGVGVAKHNSSNIIISTHSEGMSAGSTVLIVVILSEAKLTDRFVTFTTGYGVGRESIGFSCIGIGKIGRIAVRDAVTVIIASIGFGDVSVKKCQFDQQSGMNVWICIYFD